MGIARDALTLRRLAPFALGVAAIAVLLAPMVLTREAFGPDWTVHQWLLWRQSDAIRAGGLPTLFVHADPIGVQFPQFAFYGGTLYALGGYLSALSGDHPSQAYVAMWALGFAMAYGGMTWLSLQAGLRGLRAQLPGLGLVTGAYFLTDVYGRGAFGETLATAALPLVIAGAASLLLAPRWRPLPVLAFALGVVVFTGSHNISLVWGAVFLLVLAAIAVWALPRHGAEFGARRIAAVAGLAGLCVAVNAWFLLPDIVYAGRTAVTDAAFQAAQGFERGFSDPVSRIFGRPGLVFSPLRPQAPESTTPSLFVQLPVFLMAWLLVALAFAARARAGRAWGRTAAGLLALTAVLVALVSAIGLWGLLPEALRVVQYAYRIESYALIALALLTVVALRGLDWLAPRVRATLVALLVAVMAYGGVLAAWQVWETPNYVYADRNEIYAGRGAVPATWYDQGAYRDRSLRVVDVAPERVLRLDPSRVAAGGPVPAQAPAGPAPIRTNIASAPYLTDVDGVRVLGRSPDGFLVVARESPGPVRVTLARAASLPLVAGPWLTAAALVALLALVVRLALRRRRPAVFLDRDGVLNDPVADSGSGGRAESPYRPEDVRLAPGAVAGCKRLREAGFALVVVTNQPAAAKGTATPEALAAVQARVEALLAAEGVVLDGAYACHHHPQGTVPALTRVCDCRKPAPGLLLRAASELGLRRSASWMVGDSDSDVEAGRRAGCRTVLIEHPGSAHRRAADAAPADASAPDLEAAAAVILGDEVRTIV